MLLCLDSKTGGGKLAGKVESLGHRLCLDSKTGGGKLTKAARTAS